MIVALGQRHRFFVPHPERILILLTFGALIVASWGWLAYQGGAMRGTGLARMTMPGTASWNVADLGLVFLMWAVMMAAMMLPTAMPMLLMFGRVNASRIDRGRALPRTWLFALGYLSAWMAFSVLATLMQWGMHAAALVSPMAVATPAMGGLVLLLAGIYQWTPLKQACLAQCRAPLGFLLNHWRDGASGAFGMGLLHGLYCLGCCWLLTLLLFVLGVMNIAWIAALAALMLLEKTLPRGLALARAGGLVFAVWGALLLFRGGL